MSGQTQALVSTCYVGVCPCKDCKERTVECHGKCEKYQEWLKTKPKNLNAFNERRWGRKTKK